MVLMLPNQFMLLSKVRSPLKYTLFILTQFLPAGTIFDVTHKADVYGPGKSYNIFAGKDGSKGLGMSSLKIEHAIPDYSDLPENEMKVLDDWHSFFSYVSQAFLHPNTDIYVYLTRKRYNIVGKVTDLPPSVSNL